MTISQNLINLYSVNYEVRQGHRTGSSDHSDLQMGEQAFRILIVRKDCPSIEKVMEWSDNLEFTFTGEQPQDIDELEEDLIVGWGQTVEEAWQYAYETFFN